MFSKRLKKTAYRTWHRALFRLQAGCGLGGAARQPAQTIFMHMPKTAGSSINEYFYSFIGGRHGNRHVPIDMFRGDAYDSPINAQGLEKAKHARFVTGHIDWDTVTVIRQSQAFLFTILRDPAERLLSHYHYIHRIDENKQPTAHAQNRVRHMKSLTFAAFCTCDDPDLLFSTNNFMVRQMAGRLVNTFAPETPFDELLDRALQNLQTLNYVGFQQTLEKDFQAIVQKTGFPKLRLPKENITKNLAAHAGPSYDASVNKQDILTHAGARIKWDIALYQQALALAADINSRAFRRT